MKTKSLFLGMLALLAVSCGSKSESNESGSADANVVKPASTTITGELGDYYSLVDKTYPLMSKDDPKIFIEFQRNDTPFPDAESTKIELTVEYLDKDGATVAKYPMSDYQCTDIKSLRSGETSSLGGYVLAEEAPKISSFKVKGDIKFDGVKDSKVEEAVAAEDTEGSYLFEGTVGKYPVELSLEVNDNTAEGLYRYTKSGSGDWIDLSGSYKDGRVTLTEEYDGKITGTWVFILNTDADPVTAVGTMTNAKATSFDIRLEGGPAMVGSMYTNPDPTASDNEIDKLLDEYESAVESFKKIYSGMMNGTTAPDYSKYEAAHNKMLSASEKLANKSS